jgi:GMP reductase
VHKHYSVEEWSEWSATHTDVLPFLAVSSGTSDADFAKVDAIMDVVNVPFICLDVANGYSEHVSKHKYRTHHNYLSIT